MTTKVCSKCKIEKPVDQFSKRTASHDGLVASCKACNSTPEARQKAREASRKYLQTDKGKAKNRERSRRNFHNNPKTRAYLIGYQKKRRHNDPEYAEKSRDYRREYGKKWKEKNPEKAKASERKSLDRIANTPEIRARQTEYERNRRHERQKSDPVFHEHLMDLAKRGYHKRRARIAQTGGSYTRSEWRKMCEFYDHRCLCCGMKFQRLTVDHVLPLSKGGTNNIQNIQPLCRSCNSRKHNKEIDYRYALPLWFGEET